VYKAHWTVVATLALLLAAGGSVADDTDIYLLHKEIPVASQPMIMFSLDYRPNLGSIVCQKGECQFLVDEGFLPKKTSYTFFEVLRASLQKVMKPLDGVRVGLMLNHDNRNNCAGPTKAIPGCSNGGYIAMGFESLEADDANGAKKRFDDILAGIPIPAGKQSHSYQGKELFFEFYRYLTGGDVYNGHNGYTDYSSPVATNLDGELDAKGKLGGIAWDKSVENAAKGTYLSPLAESGSCTRIFTVNFLFQVSGQEDDSNAAIGAAKPAGFGWGSKTTTFEDVIGYLHDTDLSSSIDGMQDVTSYFLVDPTKINTKTTKYAEAGATGQPLPMSSDPTELVNTLQNIFQQVLAVSTTFVSVSVPINSLNRAEVLDNVFLALFQPDEDLRPYWYGNVKKLKLAGLNGGGDSVFLQDVANRPAVAADGRISFEALTYWTVPEALPPADLTKGEIEGRDGRSVARGGAGQKIPGFISGVVGAKNADGGRTVYYDKSASSLAALDVDSTVATELKSSFGAATDTEALEYLRFARGLDVDDIDNDDETDEARPWLVGSALHSRPVPVNYGVRDGYATDNPELYVAVGTNDGALHFIRNTTTDKAESGAEAWAFMPKRLLSLNKTLRPNATGVAHTYGVDGAPVTYVEDENGDGTINGSDRVYLYVGLRRGGDAYFGFDVTDPLAPKLLWTIEHDASEYAELGLTFSTPEVGLLKIDGDVKPVLVFGGGYDVDKDYAVTDSDDVGAALYVVDGESGDLVWKAVGPTGTPAAETFVHASLVDAIASPVSAVDTDGDGLLDRVVVGDTGGNVWRADLNGDDPSVWKLTLLAQLGRHMAGASGKASDRRFFHNPDLVASKDDDGPFDAVLIGSGDREDPLDLGGNVDNYFYMIKDRNITPGSGTDTAYTHADLVDVTDCLDCEIDLPHGWRLALEADGEKSLATALTIDGTVFFTTYLPPGTDDGVQCAPAEGTGRLYAVALKDASPTLFEDPLDSGDPDDPPTADERFDELDSPGIPSEVVSLPPDKLLRPDLKIQDVPVSTRWQTFWHLEDEVD
jgi:type IV pilus assembly protein PilY1